MPQKSGIVDRSEASVAYVARRIKERREAVGLSQDELTERCNDALSEMGALGQASGKGKQITAMDGKRIAKIEAAADPKKNWRAKLITQAELLALAKALECSLESLMPPLMIATEAVCSFPLSDQYATQILERLQQESIGSNELLGWAEFLPCSLETKEFMEAHHRGLFQRETFITEDVERLLNAYNTIGERRREQFVNGTNSRSWALVQLMFHDDLERIALGRDEYEEIPVTVRRACFDNLARILSDTALRAELIVAERADIPKRVGRALRAGDSLVAIDTRFAFWRDTLGSLYYTSNEEFVRRYKRPLDEFRGSARYRRTEDVLSLVEGLKRRCR